MFFFEEAFCDRSHGKTLQKKLPRLRKKIGVPSYVLSLWPTTSRKNVGPHWPHYMYMATIIVLLSTYGTYGSAVQFCFC